MELHAAAVESGLDDAARDLGWFSEVLGNLWAVVGPLIPWWAWPLVITGMTLALILRSKTGRELLVRFALGLPMDGKARTNAEAFRSATRRLEAFEDTRPSAWHYKPYAVRALIRWLVTVWALTLVTGAVTSSWVALGAAAAVALSWALIRWRKQVAKGARWVAEHRPALPVRARSRAALEDGERLALEATPAEDLDADGQAAALALATTYAGDPEDDDDMASALRPVRDMEADIQDPIWDGARVALELSEMAKARDYLILPESVDTDDAVVTVRLPRAWQAHPEQRKLLDHAVMSRLPGEWESAYATVGQDHTATYRRVARPPVRVEFPKVSKVVLSQSSATAPVLGIGPRGKCVASDFASESPHVLLSMGSGAGKSSAIKALIVPMLIAGAQVYIADPKWNSHLWALGLPNVYIASNTAEIFDMLIWLAEDAELRQQEIRFHSDIQHVRRVVVLEEMNLLGRKLRKHWRAIMPKGAKAGDNPAFEAMADLSAAGRSAYYHLIAVAQMLTTHTMGPEGNTTRENFATRILGRYSRNNWKMLVPEVSPMPATSEIQGRVQVVIGGAATETQVVYYTDEEARAAAVSGIVSRCPVPPTTVEGIPGMTSPESRSVPSGRDADTADEAQTPEWIAQAGTPWGVSARTEDDDVMDAEVIESERDPMGPAKAHAEGIFGSASLEAARKAVNRAVERGELIPVKEVRKGSRVEKLFDPVDLANWWDSRTAAKK